jgi:hypothetical protein
MPADPSGVTTDDQGPHRNGGGDPTSVGANGGPSDRAATPPERDPHEPDVSASGGAQRNSDSVANGEVATASASTRSGEVGGPAAAMSSGRGPAGSPAPSAAYAATPGSVTGPANDRDPGYGPAGPVTAGPPPAPDLGLQRPQPSATVPVTAEPPPAPVLVPPVAPGRSRRGRHVSARADRASRRGLRVNQRLWSIDVWSVFKVSVLFYLCLGLIILVAGTLLYNAGRSAGTVDQVESFVTRMGAYGSCVPKAEVAEGTEFEEDDDCADGEVLVGGFTVDDGTLFRAAAIGGGILVVAGSIGNVLMTVLLNLLNEATGGLRHTVIREPVARPPGGSPGAPGGSPHVPSGSLRRRAQR